VQLFSHLHHWGRTGRSHAQRTHSNTIALLSSSEMMGAFCLSSKYPSPFANPCSARLRSSAERRLNSTSSTSRPTKDSSTSGYLGRTYRGVRGVICTLSREVETPGERRGDLLIGISRVEFCGGGNGERLFRLRTREGMQKEDEVLVKCCCCLLHCS
jgi:hypothetical protein